MTDTAQALVIRGRNIRFDENGLACLNDIHRAAGFTKNQRPHDWTRLAVTMRKVERVLEVITGKSRNYDKADMQRDLPLSHPGSSRSAAASPASPAAP